MATKRDYYQVLGVPRTATPDEIKSAFRRLAKENHPDRNPGDKAAEARFKEANEAQEALLDDQKRAAYDRYGHAGLDPSQGMGANPFRGGGGGGAGGPDLNSIFDDIFGEMTGRARADRGRGSDLRVDTQITLEQAFAGTKVNLRVPSSVQCEVCNGSGSESRSGTTACPTCNGQGKIRMQQGFFVVERTCATCAGSGKIIKDPCKICLGQGRVQRERTLSVAIPAGIEDGVRIRMAGEGEAGLRGSPPGDLYVQVSVKPHAMFQREDSNLYLRVPLRMATAALGGSIEVPSIDGGRSKVTIPAGTQSGDQFRLRGKGMSVLRRSERGDLYIQVQVETPVNLSKRQMELLKEFEAAEGKSDAKGTSPESEGFFARVKEFFDDLGGGRG